MESKLEDKVENTTKELEKLDLVKGMRQLDKNIIVDLQSKKKSWEDLLIPETIM
jgi:hypothetical protein